VGKLFATFERSAFRLETRDRYNVPSERESLQRFLAGHPDQDYARGRLWYETTRQAAAEGRPYSRVRVVTVPLGDYSRYALWCARDNIAAGEDIRYLDRARAADLGLPVDPPLDAWLFDDARVAVLHFDDEDAFIGVELDEDPATVSRYQAWRELAWKHALTLDAFQRSL
jgi:hypothetical protein